MATSLSQATVLTVVVLEVGAATMTLMNDDITEFPVPDMEWEPGSALDGRLFYAVGNIKETGDVIEDELSFVDGAFQSANCQKYCNFGWSTYQTWTENDVIHFTTTTECQDAPHTVVWYGTVTGDTVHFEVGWTTKRWYWTRQIEGVGEASVTRPRDWVFSG